MIIAISNQKGGVGKTTSVINIGAFLAHSGKKVLLIDLDPQSNLTSGIGVKFQEDDERETVYDLLVNKTPIEKIVIDTGINNLSIAPSKIELAGAEIEMVNAMSREGILRRAVEGVLDNYDYVLIDCPPSLGLLTINGLVAAEKVIIPVQTEYFALEGLGQLVNTINLVKSNLNPTLEIGGVLMTMFDGRTNLSKDVAKELESFFENKVFKSIVPRNIKLSEAPSHGLPIMEFDPSSSGAAAYQNLVDEMLERFENKKPSIRRPLLK